VLPHGRHAVGARRLRRHDRQDAVRIGDEPGITIRTGQTHVQRYTQLLLEKIEAGEIDPSFVITHRAPLDDAPELYRKFRDKQDGCIKVVMTP
jgi:threonine dehydrogenase-like Zn-dependent dehydrogenase